jgi:hypothetical protein
MNSDCAENFRAAARTNLVRFDGFQWTATTAFDVRAGRIVVVEHSREVAKAVCVGDNDDA